MRGAEIIIERGGFALERDLPGGHRYYSARLDLRIDIFKTESWGIVGKGIYGKGGIALAEWIQANQKAKVENPSKPAAKRRRTLFLALATKDGVTDIYLIGEDRGEVAHRMRIQAERKAWAKHGIEGSISYLDL